MAATNRKLVKTYLLPKEKDDLKALAIQTNLSVSELARRLLVGKKLPDSNKHHSVIELMKINADLARLGNLLRMTLSDEDLKPPENMDLEELFDSIIETKNLLRTKIEEL